MCIRDSCYSERIIYDDACHLKKFCVNPVGKEVTAVSKRLGKNDMVVEKLCTFLESCGSMVQTQLQPPRSKWTPWSRCLSVCLSVCPSVYRHQKFGFIKQVAKGWIATVKDLESWRFERYPFVRAYTDIVFIFFSFEGRKVKCDCNRGRTNSNNRSMWLP